MTVLKASRCQLLPVRCFIAIPGSVYFSNSYIQNQQPCPLCWPEPACLRRLVQASIARAVTTSHVESSSVRSCSVACPLGSLPRLWLWQSPQFNLKHPDQRSPPIYHTHLHSKWNREELHNSTLIPKSLIGIGEFKTSWTIWAWQKDLWSESPNLSQLRWN